MTMMWLFQGSAAQNGPRFHGLNYDTDEITPLWHYIHEKQWPKVKEEVKARPCQAQIWMYRTQSDDHNKLRWRLLPLHACLIFKCPKCVLRDIIKAYPEGCQMKDDQNQLPIHLASQKHNARDDYEVLNILVDSYPEGLTAKGKQGMLPRDLIQDNIDRLKMSLATLDPAGKTSSNEKENPTSVSRSGIAEINYDLDEIPPLYDHIQTEQWSKAKEVAEEDPQQAQVWVHRTEVEDESKHRWRILPLHAAIIFSCPKSVLKIIIDAYPEATSMQDDQLQLPIHLALKNHTTYGDDLFKLLVDAYPHGLAVKDRKGRVPHEILQENLSLMAISVAILSISSSIHTGGPSSSRAIRKGSNRLKKKEHDEASRDKYDIKELTVERISSNMKEVDYDSALVTPLFKSIQSLQWSKVKETVAEDPQQAQTWIFRMAKGSRKTVRWKMLPLHASIIFKCPNAVLKSVIEAYPEASLMKDDCGFMPLQLARKKHNTYDDYDDEALDMLVEAMRSVAATAFAYCSKMNDNNETQENDDNRGDRSEIQTSISAETNKEHHILHGIDNARKLPIPQEDGKGPTVSAKGQQDKDRVDQGKINHLQEMAENTKPCLEETIGVGDDAFDAKTFKSRNALNGGLNGTSTCTKDHSLNDASSEITFSSSNCYHQMNHAKVHSASDSCSNTVLETFAKSDTHTDASPKSAINSLYTQNGGRFSFYSAIADKDRDALEKSPKRSGTHPNSSSEAIKKGQKQKLEESESSEPHLAEHDSSKADYSSQCPSAQLPSFPDPSKEDKSEANSSPMMNNKADTPNTSIRGDSEKEEQWIALSTQGESRDHRSSMEAHMEMHVALGSSGTSYDSLLWNAMPKGSNGNNCKDTHDSTPKALKEVDYDSGPTTKLFEFIQSSDWSKVTDLAKENPEQAKIWIYRIEQHDNKRLRWRVLPIHACIIFKCPISVLRAVIDAYPQGCSLEDDQGCLPLDLVKQQDNPHGDYCNEVSAMLNDVMNSLAAGSSNAGVEIQNGGVKSNGERTGETIAEDRDSLGDCVLNVTDEDVMMQRPQEGEKEVFALIDDEQEELVDKGESNCDKDRCALVEGNDAEEAKWGNEESQVCDGDTLVGASEKREIVAGDREISFGKHIEGKGSIIANDNYIHHDDSSSTGGTNQGINDEEDSGSKQLVQNESLALGREGPVEEGGIKVIKRREIPSGARRRALTYSAEREEAWIPEADCPSTDLTHDVRSAIKGPAGGSSICSPAMNEKLTGPDGPPSVNKKLTSSLPIPTSRDGDDELEGSCSKSIASFAVSSATPNTSEIEKDDASYGDELNQWLAFSGDASDVADVPRSLSFLQEHEGGDDDGHKLIALSDKHGTGGDNGKILFPLPLEKDSERNDKLICSPYTQATASSSSSSSTGDVGINLWKAGYLHDSLEETYATSGTSTLQVSSLSLGDENLDKILGSRSEDEHESIGETSQESDVENISL